MLNINPNLYLGSHEMRRAFRSIKEEGYQKLFAAFVQSYGVAFTTPTSLQVVQGSAGVRWLTIKSGLAVDGGLNTISLPEDVENAIQFPNAAGTYYLTIKHKLRNTEDGTVNIATDGSITGTNTKFTEVLRGAPLNQVKVRFPGSTNNLNDYPVLEVIDDTNAILNSSTSLTSETDMKYSVVGCFTPGTSIPSANKLIYSYDDYELALTNVGLTPNYVFKLAQVTWDGTTLTIVDAREQNKLALYDTTADLVAQITNSVITAYNLQITTQFAADLAAINATLSSLQAADVNFNTLLTNLTALVNQKANSAVEAWHFVGDPGEVSFNALFFLNALGGSGRSKFKKDNMGTCFLHVYVTAQQDCPFGTVVFTLPAGYRPTAAISIPVSKWMGTGFASIGFASINPNGEIAYAESADFPDTRGLQFHTSFQTQ